MGWRSKLSTYHVTCSELHTLWGVPLPGVNGDFGTGTGRTVVKDYAVITFALTGCCSKVVYKNQLPG